MKIDEVFIKVKAFWKNDLWKVWLAALFFNAVSLIGVFSFEGHLKFVSVSISVIATSIAFASISIQMYADKDWIPIAIIFSAATLYLIVKTNWLVQDFFTFLFSGEKAFQHITCHTKDPISIDKLVCLTDGKAKELKLPFYERVVLGQRVKVVLSKHSKNRVVWVINDWLNPEK